MIIVWQILYAFFCVGFAYLNYYWISKDYRINHSWNGVLHIAIWLLITLWTQEWFLLLIFPFIGRLFFDRYLNLFRHLPVSYLPDSPDSWLDRQEKKVFKNGLRAKVIYAIFIVIFNILYQIL